MSEIEIRAYDPSDQAACRELWVELTEWHRQIYSSPGIGGDDPGAQFDEHLAAVGPELIWVASSQGRVIGLTGLILRGTEAEIEPVVVAASHRRRGIGAALMERVIGEAALRGVSLLSVRPVGRNRDALAFFRDSGFDIVGHVELFMDMKGGRDWARGDPLGGLDTRH